MGFMYWFRVVLMIFAFVGVVLVIREVNQPASARRAQFMKLLGQPGADKVADVNLCPTRVTKIESVGGPVIRQDGMTWLREEAGQSKPMDQVAVEKWFAKYCRFAGEKVSASATVTPVLKVEFVSGEPQTLIRSAGGEYEWMGQPFASPVMTEALQTLRDLR